MGVVFDPLLGKFRMADSGSNFESGESECDCDSISQEEIEDIIENTDN